MDARATDYDNDKPEADGQAEAPAKKGRGRSLIRLAILALVVIALGAGYYFYSQHAALYPSTNDAQVGAHVITIAPQVTGTVLKVDVKSYSKVKKGEVLVEIDPAPFQAAVSSAEAKLALARQQVDELTQAVNAAESALTADEATLSNAQSNWERISKLVAEGNLAQSQEDSAKASLVQAQAAVRSAEAGVSKAKAARGAPGDKNANVVAAQAALDTAKLDLGYATITAPANGIVGDVSARPGSLAAAGTQLFQIVDIGRWWVDANFKETALSRIHDGQPAKITIDMLPGVSFSGKVVAMSPASGAAFSLFPPNNATGNWVKVTQRFPVRVMFDPGKYADRVRIGGSANVTVDTSKADR